VKNLELISELVDGDRERDLLRSPSCARHLTGHSSQKTEKKRNNQTPEILRKMMGALARAASTNSKING